tara:strand:- start:2176 stop:2619 length:444 start_codon:yes stop_codon:yes gene_type:complete
MWFITQQKLTKERSSCKSKSDTKVPQPTHKRQVKQIDHTRGMRINIQSRKVPEFKKVGYLSQNDQELNEDIPYILPVYGRPTYRGSHKWNYYTLYNEVRIPIHYKNQNCNTKKGCDEIFDNEIVYIDAFQSNYTLQKYDTSIQYIPY